MDYSRIIIIGAGASGKDHLAQRFIKRGFQYAVTWTTRPMRPGEENGKDYFFVSEEEFKQKIDEGFFYEYVDFNNWYYGTPKEYMETPNMIFIMTVSGIKKLSAEDRSDSFIIYLDISSETRYKRLKMRKDADNAERRLKADNDDLNGFNDYDLRVTNEDF